ncbi:MAG TPA: hypothetical protein VM121_09215 [Acidimicrobiales bacterium]|nr:hypothetical protein [Acidimicrobiales bacterium]
MSRRNTDVPIMMSRVEATLETAERSVHGASGVLGVDPEGDRDVAVGQIRQRADIDTAFLSGSDRPVVGTGVRLAKRLVRRSLRWYLEPMMAQQSRFNHATLDAIEQLRLRVNRLTAEVEHLRQAGGNDTPGE